MAERFFKNENETGTVSSNGLTLYFKNETKSITHVQKRRIMETFFTQYPKLIKQYNTEALKMVTFFIDPGYEAVTEAGGSSVRLNPVFFYKDPG